MKRRRTFVLFGIVILTLVVNIIAWQSSVFCDFYVQHIYPVLGGIYGMLTGWIPFSVGEFMIVTGLILAAAAALLGFVAVFFLLFLREKRVFIKIKKISSVFYRSLALIMTVVFVVMTLNCFIPFHCSFLDEKYDLRNSLAKENIALEDLANKEYTLEELALLRDFVVIKTNELALTVDRDEKGNIIYPDNMEEIAIESMKNLSAECPQLRGYYPKPKQIAFSGILSQQYMKGYFFPFSMEANYNSLMHPINRPATICHEYAHLKGFMYEDEANMIGFLACINSSDPTFRYSGYLSILNYVNNQFYDAIGRDKEIYTSHVEISQLVKKENVFLEKETWKKVEAKAVINTEVIGKASDKLTEATLVFNGVEDGMDSYTRVVGLLLRYYDGSDEINEAIFGEEYLAQSQ